MSTPSICPKCGNNYTRGAIVCLRCGEVLVTVSSPSPPDNRTDDDSSLADATSVDEPEESHSESTVEDDEDNRDTDPALVPAKNTGIVRVIITRILGVESSVVFDLDLADIMKHPARIGRRDEDKRISIRPEVDLTDVVGENPPLSRLQASLHWENGVLKLNAVSGTVGTWIRQSGAKRRKRVAPHTAIEVKHKDEFLFGVARAKNIRGRILIL